MTSTAPASVVAGLDKDVAQHLVHLERARAQSRSPMRERLDRLGVEAARGGSRRRRPGCARPARCRLPDGGRRRPLRRPRCCSRRPRSPSSTAPSVRLPAASRQLEGLLLGLDVAVADVFVGRPRLAAGSRGVRARWRTAVVAGLVAAAAAARRHAARSEPTDASCFTPSSFGASFCSLVTRLAEEIGLAACRARCAPSPSGPRWPWPPGRLRERAREQAERVEVAGVGLEADLQLGERLHPVVRAVARQVELGRDARMRRVGACAAAGAR